MGGRSLAEFDPTDPFGAAFLDMPPGLDPAMGDFVSLDDAYPLPPVEAPPLPTPAAFPQTLQLTASEEMRLLAQVQKHYDEALEGREAMLELRALRYRRYLADVTLRDGMQPWDEAPQLFVPLTRQTIETLTGRFKKGVLGNEDVIELKGVGEEDVAQAHRKQAFHRWQLFQLNKFSQVMDDALMDAALDGLGLIKVYRYASPYPLPPGLELLQTQVKYECIDLGTMLLPPDAKGLQYPDARYLGQQLWIVPEDEFPGLLQRGFQLPDLPPDVLRDDYEPSERERIELLRDAIAPDAWQENRLELDEMYEVFTREDGSRVFCLVHWFPKFLSGAAGTGLAHLARVVPLEEALPQQVFPRPMWPYFGLVLWPQPRQLRGLNVPDRLESAQDALNRLSEQMLHFGDITILPLVFANVALTGTIPDLTHIKPGQIVPLDNLGPNGLVIHQPSSQNNHFVQQMNTVRQWAEEDLNVTSFTQGRSATQPNAPRTLGGLALLLQQGSEAFDKQINLLAEQLTDPLKFGYALWQQQPVGGLQFLAPQGASLEDRLYGPEVPTAPMTQVQMQDQDLSGLFDVKIKVNPQSAIEQQKVIQLGEKLDAIIAPVYPKGRRLLWKRVWEDLGLQGFDLLYPEQVASQQTMLQALALEVQLLQLEGQLAQLGPAGVQAMQHAQALAGGAGEAPPGTAPQPSALPGAPSASGVATQPMQQGPDLQAIIDRLMQHAGTVRNLPQSGVNETPGSVMVPGG